MGKPNISVLALILLLSFFVIIFSFFLLFNVGNKSKIDILDVDCGKLPSLPYGSVNYLNGTTHLESEVVYSCVHNYRISGNPRRKCLESQHWSGSAPKCEGT